MKQYNPITWFEIVVNDLERAMEFYQSVFNVEFQQHQMGPATMAIFSCSEHHENTPLTFENCQRNHQPNDSVSTLYLNGALVCGEAYKDNIIGNGSVIIYLNVNAIGRTLDKIERAGGKILSPCLNMGENGCLAKFIDSEGNCIGLWSKKP